jgi:hypothetical protein
VRWRRVNRKAKEKVSKRKQGREKRSTRAGGDVLSRARRRGG